ncbi:unnamed protein product [Parascedosporium putredinis]|uniref:Uncharacterized protein n=1 Tax=Parascedosporium putredinis TaxID=1442378 RepID=A0A9P1GXF9_9PEZI|nr:unnamed protein product [Parascedosporium putredinis]CAI7989209.1 unnamed protein product [Parascedosporium putredinis]
MPSSKKNKNAKDGGVAAALAKQIANNKSAHGLKAGERGYHFAFDTFPRRYPDPTPGSDNVIVAGYEAVVVSSGVTGECWVYRQLPADGGADVGFGIVAKCWTSIQRALKSSDASDDGDRTRLSPAPPRPMMPNMPILALNGRWLAYCPPSQSSQISLRAHIGVPVIGKGPGVSTVTAPPVPTANLATDLPLSEGIMNKLMRETTQELIQGAKWVGQQGKQAWNAYWNKSPSPNQPQLTARSPPAPSQPWGNSYPPRQDAGQFPRHTALRPKPSLKTPVSCRLWISIRSRGGMYRDFNVPGIPEDILSETTRHFINGDDDMYLSDRDMDAGNTVTLETRPRIVEPEAGTESSIPQVEIESSAPYQPFHTDRRVALYSYDEGSDFATNLLLGDLSLDDATSSKKKKGKSKKSSSTGGGFSASGSGAWAFGQALPATKLDLGLPDNNDTSLILPEDHRALPASAIERVLQVGANEEQIVVTTRRRRGARHAEHEDDGFFEDDCEVLDFADQRV